MKIPHFCPCSTVTKHSKCYISTYTAEDGLQHFKQPWFQPTMHPKPQQSNSDADLKKNLTIDHKPRYNDFGIQMISNELYKQLFTKCKSTKDNKVVERCLAELKSYNFLKCNKPTPLVNLKIPELAGDSVEEHFYNIGEEQSKPYKNLILGLLKGIPEIPSKWELTPGWTRYKNGGFVSVDHPAEDALVFDVEVCCTAGPFPTLATAVSEDAWYGWVSSDLVKNISSKHTFSPDHLIPLESTSRIKGHNLPKSFSKPRIVIGHNVSYDRARVKEQYWLEQTALRFIDTMSLHICASGVTSYQKALLKAGVGDEEWTKLSSLNSLGKVYQLYCGGELPKEGKEFFLNGSLNDISNNFQLLMDYCANDVKATFFVMQKLFPLFIERFPHPITLSGMLELQSTYVPVNANWKKYLVESHQAFDDLNLEAKNLLAQSANNACQLLHNDKYKSDVWLWDQDWSVKHLSLKKIKKMNNGNNGNYGTLLNCYKEDIVEEKLQQLKNKFHYPRSMIHNLSVRSSYLPGYPTWYRKLCTKPDFKLWVPEPQLISTALKIVPKLLRLTWKSFPLHHEKGYGWGYLVPNQTDIAIANESNLPQEVLKTYCQIYCNVCSCKLDQLNSVEEFTYKNYQNCSKQNNKSSKIKFLLCKAEMGNNCGLVRLPHKDGTHLNVGNPLSRDFINKFSDNELSGATFEAKKVIEISRKLSYWRNNRERIQKQLVCWLTKKDLPKGLHSYNESCEFGVILPQVVVCGTLTRRAVEPTWMTVSNALSERVGSELRGIVQAPPGYCLVGADVDSQELWIASLLGDAYSLGEHGATPFGWMTLNGQKSEGTDMHSVTAKTIGISRNDAKTLNYARIYGAGQKFSEQLLKQFNPEMTPKEASQKASKMMELTKGKRLYTTRGHCLSNLGQKTYTKEAAQEVCRIYQKGFAELFSASHWQGGSESAMFNSLEEIANQEHPQTPFLKSRLSRALEPSIDKNDKYSSTRINWVVQSGAVDFLHLMLASMRWFLGKKARFCLSFHDEIRYMVPEKFKYETALALHVTNLLTRAFCVTSVGMTDLPQSVAFFSSVDIDVVLRKESKDDNKTPSNPFGLSKGYGIPKGESLDIYKAIEKANGIVGFRN